MNALLPNFIARYYILFFEQFIKEMSIPKARLELWRTFKLSLKEVPISLESLHNQVIEIIGCKKTLTLEELEELVDPIPVTPYINLEFNCFKPEINEESPRHTLGKNLKSDSPTIPLKKHFIINQESPQSKQKRSATVDFSASAAAGVYNRKVPNPFLGTQNNSTQNNKLYQNVIIPVTYKMSQDYTESKPKVSEDSSENNRESPLIAKSKTSEFRRFTLPQNILLFGLKVENFNYFMLILKF